MFCSLGDAQIRNGVAFVSCWLQDLCTCSFISGNSHQSIAKGGIVNWWLQQYVSSGKANIRCNCLAVSSGLEIASSNRIWAVVLSHIVTRVEGFYQSSPDISPPSLPTPCFLLLLVLSDWLSLHLEFNISAKVYPIKRCDFVPRHA